MIKFIIAKREVNQNQIFKPEIPIDKTDFVELVDHSTWLTWHELTTWGKEFHDKNPNFAKKLCKFSPALAIFTNCFRWHSVSVRHMNS